LNILTGIFSMYLTISFKNQIQKEDQEQVIHSQGNLLQHIISTTKKGRQLSSCFVDLR
jgi:hypothetical protein